VAGLSVTRWDEDVLDKHRGHTFAVATGAGSHINTSYMHTDAQPLLTPIQTDAQPLHVPDCCCLTLFTISSTTSADALELGMGIITTWRVGVGVGGEQHSNSVVAK